MQDYHLFKRDNLWVWIQFTIFDLYTGKIKDEV